MKKRFLSLALALLMILAAVPAAVAADDNIINFPDPNFKEAVLREMGKKSTDSITKAEAAKVTKLGVYGTNKNGENAITSLSGIEYFTALTELKCFANHLTALDVSKNTALEWLDCGSNQLTALDLSKNAKLLHFECRFNQIAALDLSKNTALTYFDCSYNQLTALDVSKNINLINLGCDNNKLTTLNVTNNLALKSLHCESNQLTALDISKNTALQVLYCGGNYFPSETAIIGLDKERTFYVFNPQNQGTPPIPSLTAVPSQQKVFVNGKETAFDAYNISGSNYFKLRDLAYALNGTSKNFDVGYDAATGAVTLTSGKAYAAAGGEMALGDGTPKVPTASTNIFYLDGKKVEITAYNIGGNNYLKLRDVMKLLDAFVGYDGTVIIDTGKGYVD